MEFCDCSANVWINANAGSGKTTALVNRFLALLLNGFKHSEILCLTYTNVARDEMQSRIVARLKSWEIMDELSLKKEVLSIGFGEPYIKRARELLNEVASSNCDFKITTIHAFCLQILRRYSPFWLDKGMKVIGENELSELSDFLLNKMVHSGDKILEASYAFLYSNYSFDKVTKVVSSFLEKRSDLWRMVPKFDSAIDFAKGVMPQEQLFFLEKDVDIDGFLNELRDCDCTLFGGLDFTNSGAIDVLRQLVFTQSGTVRKKLLKDEENALIVSKIVNFFDAFDRQNESRGSFHTMVLVYFLEQFYCRYTKEHGLVSFDEIIDKAVEILQDENQFANYALDLQISHIMLDEAQDTSPKSWEVIRLLSREFFTGIGTRDEVKRTIFVVGDAKQSIFSFQGADLNLFYENKEYFKHKSAECKTEFKEINFEESYRTPQGILDFVDSICNDPARHGSFSMDRVRHVSNKQKQDFELKEIEVPSTDKIEFDKFNWVESIRARAAEGNEMAVSIFKKVHELVQSGERPEDVMVLFSSRTKGCGLFYDVYSLIRDGGIEVEIIGSQKENILVHDLVSVLRFFALPTDDYNLACLLKSDFFGFSDAEVVFLKEASGGSLYKKLQNVNGTTNKILNAKYTIARSIEFFTSCKSIKELLVYITQEWNAEKYLEYISALYDFIDDDIDCKNYLDELIYKVIDSSIFDNKLRHCGKLTISTIHGSKGLEAKNVIVVFENSSNKISQSPILLTNSGAVLFDSKSKFDFVIEKRDEILLKQKEEDDRLLYVALTRAKQNLFIFSFL